MKRSIIIILFFVLATCAFGQRRSDSLAYQLQRKKINAMLAQRAEKFGQYDESLKQHTGIFGLQTKKDIRNSNAILMDIAKTDDDIYKEIKVLLDFRAYQQTQVQTKVNETEENTLGYMVAINKLRNQVEKLKGEAAKQQKDDEKTNRTFIIVVLTLSAIILLLLSWKRKFRAVTKPKPKARPKRRA